MTIWRIAWTSLSEVMPGRKSFIPSRTRKNSTRLISPRSSVPASIRCRRRHRDPQRAALSWDFCHGQGYEEGCYSRGLELKEESSTTTSAKKSIAAISRYSQGRDLPPMSDRPPLFLDRAQRPVTFDSGIWCHIMTASPDERSLVAMLGISCD